MAQGGDDDDARDQDANRQCDGSCRSSPRPASVGGRRGHGADRSSATGSAPIRARRTAAGMALVGGAAESGSPARSRIGGSACTTEKCSEPRRPGIGRRRPSRPSWPTRSAPSGKGCPKWVHTEGGVGTVTGGRSATATLNLVPGTYHVADTGVDEDSRPGLRPPLFHLPYEAAACGVLSAPFVGPAGAMQGPTRPCEHELPEGHCLPSQLVS